MRYEGNWVDKQKVGHGILKYPDGKRYEGNFKDDKRDGQGILYSPTGAVLKKG